jgi:hypothetical protein
MTERDRIPDIYQATELHRAAARGDAALVETIILGGVCVNKVDRCATCT